MWANASNNKLHIERLSKVIIIEIKVRNLFLLLYRKFLFFQDVHISAATLEAKFELLGCKKCSGDFQKLGIEIYVL